MLISASPASAATPSGAAFPVIRHTMVAAFTDPAPGMIATGRFGSTYTVRWYGAFDGGMVQLHHSVLRQYTAIAPRGECRAVTAWGTPKSTWVDGPSTPARVTYTLGTHGGCYRSDVSVTMLGYQGPTSAVRTSRILFVP